MESLQSESYRHATASLLVAAWLGLDEEVGKGFKVEFDFWRGGFKEIYIYIKDGSDPNATFICWTKKAMGRMHLELKKHIEIITYNLQVTTLKKDKFICPCVIRLIQKEGDFTAICQFPLPVAWIRRAPGNIGRLRDSWMICFRRWAPFHHL